MATPLTGFSVTKPSSGVTAAAGTATGSLDTSAVYQYKVSYVSAFGETEANTTATSVTTTSTGSVSLTAIPTSSNGNVIQRKLYRTVGGGSSFLLLDTIDDNTTTTYSDIIADGSLGAAVPTLNSAHSLQSIDGRVKVSMPTILSLESGITAFAGGGQTSATQLSNEVNIVGTVATIADSVKLPELSSALIGTRVLVCNDGANSMNVFPFLGQDASGGTNTAVAVAAAGRAEFIAKSATAWEKTR
jgi:hypothetical protein